MESVHRSLQRAVRLPFRRLLPKTLEPIVNAYGVRINMSLRSPSSSTSFLPSHAAGNTILYAAMAKELSSSCPIELESRSLSSSSSSSTKDAIVASSKATVDITPVHSLNSNLIEDRTTEQGAAAAAGKSQPLDRPMTSSPGRADQELPTFATCSADRSSVVWSNEPEAVDGSSVVDSITASYSEVVH